MTDERDVTEPTEATFEDAVRGAPTDVVLPASPPPTRRRRGPMFGGLRRTGLGIGAIGVKELRGRMRGRRAFVILSLYLVLLGGFAWMVELIMERTYSTGFGGSSAFATAAIGQGIFAALLMLETLLVVFLAPMSTAGAISLEREKQTLDMLAATPITSASIVVGKLVSALGYVWLLIAASIPLTAVVFVFGGVAPEDLVRGYLVLIVTALGFGSFGLFCSSIVKRTQAATAITIFGVLGLSIGTLFVIVFWQALATPTDGFVAGPVSGPGAWSDRLPQPVPRPGRDHPDRCPVRVGQLAALLLPLPRDLRDQPERHHLRERVGQQRWRRGGHRQGRRPRACRRPARERSRRRVRGPAATRAIPGSRTSSSSARRTPSGPRRSSAG